MSVHFHCDWKGCDATIDDSAEGESGWRFYEAWQKFYNGDDAPEDDDGKFHLCPTHVAALRKRITLVE